MTDRITDAAPYNALLMLADGTVFYGFGLGVHGQTMGEICFNTGMTGYQEVLTDPSYAGQIITFTFPHIGNVGTNNEDIEANLPHTRGLVVREPITAPSSFRSQHPLQGWLQQHRITGICGVDTRALTLHIREHGAQNALILHAPVGQALPSPQELHAALKGHPNLDGMELAESVTTTEPYGWTQTLWQLSTNRFGVAGECTQHVVAIDYGEKLNILRLLADYGCKVTVVPAKTPAKDILALKPDGIFLSNGPGDPAATGQYALPILHELLESGVPIFGICLGHQLLALAMGAKTSKMHQGHRGCNHPVKDLRSGKVEITSQNHGFSVMQDSVPDDVEITHVSLFDGCIEGLRHKTKPAFCVQYHPESSPGPHDSRYLFEEFVGMMKESKSSEFRVRSFAE
ncbi:MAG: glutamine-hydrolyzing carbamoyl-phosphate synthase small subunit [Rickettsiales bacterium]|nr:glutamine-hydrolyzing carbamoyl-phosphate synthase small subunit [Rickettsiales bacterium]